MDEKAFYIKALIFPVQLSLFLYIVSLLLGFQTRRKIALGTFSRPAFIGRSPWTIRVGACAIVGVIP